MCPTPDVKPPPPPVAPPPVLEQVAPKAKSSSTEQKKKKKTGLSAYKIDTGSSASPAKTNKLGGIPKKTGV